MKRYLLTGIKLLTQGWIPVVIFVLEGSLLYAQPGPEKPVSSLEYDLIRQMTDSVVVLVRMDYCLKSATGRIYYLGDYDFFGRGYSVGILAEGKLWLDADALSPWKSDNEYIPFSQTDTLTPAHFRTHIRFLWDTAFAPVSVMQIDTFSGVAAALTLSMGHPDLKIDTLKPGREGFAIVLQPEQSLFLNEKGGVKVSIFSVKAETDHSQNDHFTASGIKVPGANALGGAFFTYRAMTGQLSLMLSGLLKPQLIRFNIVPITAFPEPLPIDENAPVKRGVP